MSAVTGACSLGSAFVVSLLGAVGGVCAVVDGSSVVVSVDVSSSGGGALTVA